MKRIEWREAPDCPLCGRETLDLTTEWSGGEVTATVTCSRCTTGWTGDAEDGVIAIVRRELADDESQEDAERAAVASAIRETEEGISALVAEIDDLVASDKEVRAALRAFDNLTVRSPEAREAMADLQSELAFEDLPATAVVARYVRAEDGVYRVRLPKARRRSV